MCPSGYGSPWTSPAWTTRSAQPGPPALQTERVEPAGGLVGGVQLRRAISSLGTPDTVLSTATPACPTAVTACCTSVTPGIMARASKMAASRDAALLMAASRNRELTLLLPSPRNTFHAQLLAEAEPGRPFRYSPHRRRSARDEPCGFEWSTATKILLYMAYPSIDRK